MKRREGKFTLTVAASVAALGLAALLVPASRLRVEAATPAQAVTQEVPSNPSTPAAPAQPIPYSHKTHSGLPGLECHTCHTNPAPGTLMAVPATSICMQCHATVAKDTPAIQKLAQYDTSRQPVPWVRVYTLRPGVQWAHRTHVDAGMTCETCHGLVAQMDVVAEVTSVTSKFGCLNCHTTRKTKTACTTCHAWFEDPALGAVKQK